MKINKVALSAALAVAVLSIAVMATGNEASLAEGSRSKVEPTPYSADHSRVQSGPGYSAEQPPTF